MPAAYPDARYLFCFRPHRYLRLFQPPPPGNVSRVLLWRDWPRNVDLFHGLNQRIDSTRRGRVVTTFHDLFVITGNYSTPEFRQRFAEQARFAAERSDLIIAVSRFTADQVASILKVEGSRIRVVYHGITPPPQPVKRENKPRNKASKKQMVLFVGAIQTRKNVLRLVKAFERTKPGWKLVLAGSLGYGAKEIIDAIESSPRRSDIELPGYVSRETLEQLYREASVFAFPSLDEGFGLPVLDAMARGVAVLTSDRSALAEIAGRAALLVDPGSADAIATGLQALMDSRGLRSDLIRRGLAHSARFSWQTAVEETWAVYRELLP